MNRRSFVESLGASVIAAGFKSPWKEDIHPLVERTVPALDSGSEAAKSIAGEWRISLDPKDAGMGEEWFKDAGRFVDRILLPGSTDERHFGQKNDKRELQHLTRTYEYTGPVWYQLDVVIPELWLGKRVVLFLERCHWQTQAWLDNVSLGLRDSLCTPHIYELGYVNGQKATGEERAIPLADRWAMILSPGPHRLTVRVDNRKRINVGESSATTAEVGATWNGIIGRMELQTSDPVWIDTISVYPVLSENKVHVRMQVRNLTGEAHSGELEFDGGITGHAEARFNLRTSAVVSRMPTSIIEQDVHLGTPPPLWSEFSAKLFNLSALLASTGTGLKFSSQAQTTFGMREISTLGKQLKLNGRTIVLRGTVDNGTFPKTGYVPMEVALWRERLQVYLDYGFNHVRFHSWCPPNAAFTAADELGILFQVENPMWIGDGRVSADDERMDFIRDEAHRIVDAYGNHPSFGLMTMGNEEGSGQDVFLADLVRDLQHRDPRHLYSTTSAPDNILRPDNYFVSAGPRWTRLRGDPRLEKSPPNTSVDYQEYIAEAKIDRPIIAHELGQWTVFPNFEEGKEYGGPLQPRYLDIYRDALNRNQLIGQAENFRRASGEFTAALYKEEIEAILRTPELSGFQLLGLTDFPGFGPAFIGVLDTLSQSKGLMTPEQYRRFCAPTVPLLRLNKRLWTNDETLVAPLDVAHYGPADLKNAAISWRILNATGAALKAGSLPAVSIATGGVTRLGEIKLPLKDLPSAAKYSIECSVGGSVNSWDVWIYPDVLAASPAGITIARRWDDATRNALREGKTVVLLPDSQKLESTVQCSFTTVFWAAAWFPERHETMGILCEPGHPALKLFATGSHSDWQWWELMSGSRAFDLTAGPPDLQPIVQVIDDAARSKRLGTVIEAKVGGGKLLATSLDLESEPEKRLAARQLQASLLSYAASTQFDPTKELDVTYLDSVFKSAGR